MDMACVLHVFDNGNASRCEEIWVVLDEELLGLNRMRSILDLNIEAWREGE